MSELIGRVGENEYQGKPLRIFEGYYKIQANDLKFEGGRLLGQEIATPISLAIHPNLSGRIIVNIPGREGHIDGYCEKYKILSHYMQSKGLGAVVRTGNHFVKGFLPDLNLKAAMDYANQKAWEICGEPNPEILLMGFSAGASAIAARAHEYPQVSTILLCAPSGNMPEQTITEGLARFKGEVYIVIGENDDVVGPDSGKIFYDLATGARHRELFNITNCDHQFKGEVNGRIISEAPFYAFAKSNKPNFPDPKGGIKLYD